MVNRSICGLKLTNLAEEQNTCTYASKPNILHKIATSSVVMPTSHSLPVRPLYVSSTIPSLSVDSPPTTPIPICCSKAVFLCPVSRIAEKHFIWYLDKNDHH